MLEALFYIITVLSIASSIATVIMRRKSYIAFTALLNADGEAMEIARQRYWKSQSMFKAPALIAMTCYVASVVPLIYFRIAGVTDIPTNAFFFSFLASSLGLLTLGSMASFYNQKEAEARMDSWSRTSRRTKTDEQAPSASQPPGKWD